jgi:hypothetical protein
MKKIINDIRAWAVKVPTTDWLMAAFFLCLVILAFLFGKGCGQPVTVINPVPDDSFIMEKADLQASIRRQEGIIDDLNKNLLEMNQDLFTARKGVIKAEGKAKTAIDMYNQAKLTTDTSAMLTFCDSVVTDHKQFVLSTVNYARVSDSIINTQSAVIDNQEKLIQKQRARITMTDAQLNKTMNDYHTLAYDNENLKKKLHKKKGGFLKGLVSGAAGILAAIILIK